MLTLSPIHSASAETSGEPPETAAVAEPVKEPSMIRKAAGFLALVVVAIVANYFVPKFVGTAFFIGTLVAYFRSKDEAFWLAFFLTVSDGFFGFFGLYKTIITVIPGLPEVEVGMIYLILTLFKARGKPIPYQPFYTRFLQILLIYIGFLLLQGYVIGVKMEINVQFRLVKWIVPLFMLYSIPRLFTRIEQYRDVFLYLFCVAFVALGTQIFTILNGSLSPGQHLGVIKKARHVIKVKAGKTYRGLYNEGILLITYFGALFFLIYRPGKYFPSWLCFAVVMANFASVFLSATRGWVICFSFSLFLSLLFVLKMSGKRLMTIGILVFVFLFSAQSLPVIGIQIENAIKRLMTIGKLAEGDETAGGSLIRLSVRGPRVMKVWSESPLTGWGFSTRFMEADDFHVGNQNILMHSGIIGYALMHLFFLYFVIKLFFRSQKQPRGSPYKGVLLFFCIFFPAWFMLHSSSQQFFSYYQFVIGGIIQALFFSMAALMYQESEEHQWT
ncbi:MAG: hypothetical protein IPJ82_20155 [Lewinellaceae bacterium]|nr:hypothetical protein [Lewinellaceae bacterium]